MERNGCVVGVSSGSVNVLLRQLFSRAAALRNVLIHSHDNDLRNTHIGVTEAKRGRPGAKHSEYVGVGREGTTVESEEESAGLSTKKKHRMEASGMEAAAYGLELRARSIAPLHILDGDPSVHRFVVGTASARVANKIHLLEYHDVTNVTDCTAVWNHDPEILRLSTLPSQTQTLFATVHRATAADAPDERRCTIFELAKGGEAELKPVQRVPLNVSHFLWDPQGLPATATAVTDTAVHSVRIETAETPASTVALPPVQRLFGAAWDPHHHDVVAVAADTQLLRVEFRSKKAIPICDHAHALSVRSIDYNPNKMYTVVSAGDDGAISFWDLRKSTAGPFFSHAGAHEHWIHSVGYNPTNDQLLLTASSDRSVKLWQFWGQSSHNQSAEEGGGATSAPSAGVAGATEGCVKRCVDFGDTVYASAWSAGSSWVYASCAYNGKVLVEHVPDQIQRQSRLRAS